MKEGERCLRIIGTKCWYYEKK